MNIIYWIIEYIICFIESYISFNFCNLFLFTKVNIRYKITTSLLIAAINIVYNYASLISVFATISILSMYFVVQYFIRKKHFFKLIFIIMLYVSVVFIVDFIFSIIISSISSLQMKYVVMEKGMSLPRTVIGLSSKICLIIIVNVMAKANSKNNYFNFKLSIVFGISSIIITLLSTVMYLTQSEKIEYDTTSFMLLFFLIMLAMILLIYFTLMYMMNSEHKKKEIALIEQQNKLLYNNMKEQEKTFSLWKQSIHDYKHKIIAIDTLIEENKYSELHNMIKKEINLFKDKALYISTGNKAVDILLNSKMHIATDKNIVFTVNIMLKDEIRISDADLCVILGNLIDNAIEASVDEDAANINVQMNFVNDIFMIKIINVFNKKLFSEQSIKKDANFHGLGIKSVKNTVAKYDGSFFIQQEDGVVTALVTI